MKVRIGTRGSDLALWQARHVKAALESAGCEVSIHVLKTRGDLIDDVPLQNVEGKAFFTAEIEQALYGGQVDLAVHSHKDLPVESPAGLCIAAGPPRAASQERLLLNPASKDPVAAFVPLAVGSRVGTSSPRRRAQLEALRPDLVVLDLRGNVPTRVGRLREGRYDAIMLAAAGLDRLQLDCSGLESVDLSPEHFVPAPAQGALALQIRVADKELAQLLARVFQHEPSAQAIHAERSLLALAGGGCNLALGASLSQVEGEWLASVFRGPDATDLARQPRWARERDRDPMRAAERALARAAADQPTLDGPLAGLRVEIVGSERCNSRLGTRLGELGASVQHRAAIRCVPLESDLAARAAELRAGDAVALTSAQAADALAGITLPEGVQLVAVGPATAEALRSVGQRVDLVGSSGARALGQRIELAAAASLLFPCAEDALDELQAGLGARAGQCTRIPVYRTEALGRVELDPEAQLRVYLSPSAVLAAASAEKLSTSPGCRHAALGPATALCLRESGIEAFCPPNVPPLADPVEALLAHLAASHTCISPTT